MAGENPKRAQIHLRLRLDREVAIGPGKADLLEGIRDTGSIAAAGRRMNMSYKRAWMLVTALNEMFVEPLVESSRGGSRGGGATLTPAGEHVLALYRQLETTVREAGAGEIETLSGMLKDISGGK